MHFIAGLSVGCLLIASFCLFDGKLDVGGGFLGLGLALHIFGEWVDKIGV